MQRWNGWGDDAITMDLPEEGVELLKTVVGPGFPQRDTSLEELLKPIPKTRLPRHPLITTDSQERLIHAHGQSLPDWIALRYGRPMRVPDGIAYPENKEDLRDLVTFASKHKIALIPYGGGTSVLGHLEVPQWKRPVVTVSLARLNRMVYIDSGSLLATFESGIRGPDLEAHLRSQGFTLGHYPQSFEYSTLGGWVATRASGQLSSHYGRIDEAFAGAELLTPRGPLVLPPYPASAAGPDLRQLVLGSEGRLGIIAEATVKISPLPEKDDIYGAFFPSWDQAVEALRTLTAARLPLSMVRLSTVSETQTNLALSGHPKIVAFLKRYLPLRGVAEEEGCLCLIGFIGSAGLVKAARRETVAILKRAGAIPFGKAMGESWKHNRFLIPYLRNTLWEQGYAVDTIETAVTWNRVTEMVQTIEKILTESLAPRNEKVHVFSHLSSIYPTGSNIYTTVLFRLGKTAEETWERWNTLKMSASSIIAEKGGTISHQHGVGVDHKPYIEAEKGRLGMDMIREMCASVDPDGLMNPTKLF